MTSTPHGYSTIGPIYESKLVKQKFVDMCKEEGITMERKLKDLIRSAILVKNPDFVLPLEESNG